MRRALAAIFLALAPAAHAAGSDPLLSGYGGPGDGEQALLGATIIREAPGGGGGGTPTPAAPSADALFEQADPTPAAAPDAGRPAARPDRRPARRPQRPARERPAPTTAPKAPAASVGTGGEAVSAPAPLAGRDLALLAAVLLGALALAGSARRLAVRAARERRPAPLQVP